MPRFARPSGIKQFFTWVSFPSAWFLKNLLGYVSLSFTAPTCREESFHCASFPLAFWAQSKFDLGLLSLSLVSPKLVGIRFPQLHGTNVWRRVVSLGLERQTKYVPLFPRPSGPKQNLTSVYFPSAWFLKTCWGTFPSASRHQHVEKSRFTVPRFPRPSGPKQFLTRVYFPSAWFLKNLLGVRFPQLHAPTCREESFHSA